MVLHNFKKKVYIVLNHYRVEFMLVIFCSKKVIPKFSRKRFILDTYMPTTS